MQWGFFPPSKFLPALVGKMVDESKNGKPKKLNKIMH